MRKEPKVEAIGDGRFRITSFIDDFAYCPDPFANYVDFSYERDVPTSFRISLIVIDVEGKLNITGLLLRFPRTARILRPLPASILKCHPVTSEHSVYLCFEPPLDLRKCAIGDVKLGMTIEGYNTGDKVFISYGTEFLVKEDC